MHRTYIERIKTFALIVLTITAVLLIRQVAIYDAWGRQDTFHTGNPVPSSTGAHRIVRLEALAVQSSAGRVGIQYAQEDLSALQDAGLTAVLQESLEAMDNLQNSTMTAWASQITSTNPWVYFDFGARYVMDTLAQCLGVNLRYPSGEALTACLLAEEKGKLWLYTHNEYTGEVRRATVHGNGGLEAKLPPLPSPNGLRFALEAEGSLFAVLAPMTMLSPSLEAYPVYVQSNPLADLTETARESLLHALSFNAQAVSYYDSADGLVIREGQRTLRLLSEGGLHYHDQAGTSGYFFAPDQAVLLQNLQDLLVQLLQEHAPNVTPYYQDSVETAGGTLVRFDYHLNGVAVQGFGAEFLVQQQVITDFTIYLHGYTQTETQKTPLPLAQTAAAISNTGRIHVPLRLRYLQAEAGADFVPMWIVTQEEG